MEFNKIMVKHTTKYSTINKNFGNSNKELYQILITSGVEYVSLNDIIYFYKYYGKDIPESHLNEVLKNCKMKIVKSEQQSIYPKDDKVVLEFDDNVVCKRLYKLYISRYKYSEEFRNYLYKFIDKFNFHDGKSVFQGRLSTVSLTPRELVKFLEILKIEDDGIATEIEMSIILGNVVVR